MQIQQVPLDDIAPGDVKAALLERVAIWFWTEWYPKNRRTVVFNLPFRPIRVYDARAIFIQLFGEPSDVA